MANKQGKSGRSAHEKVSDALSTFERTLDRVTRATDRLGR